MKKRPRSNVHEISISLFANYPLHGDNLASCVFIDLPIGMSLVAARCERKAVSRSSFKFPHRDKRFLACSHITKSFNASHQCRCTKCGSEEKRYSSFQNLTAVTYGQSCNL